MLIRANALQRTEVVLCWNSFRLSELLLFVVKTVMFTALNNEGKHVALYQAFVSESELSSDDMLTEVVCFIIVSSVLLVSYSQHIDLWLPKMCVCVCTLCDCVCGTFVGGVILLCFFSYFYAWMHS